MDDLQPRGTQLRELSHGAVRERRKETEFRSALILGRIQETGGKHDRRTTAQCPQIGAE